MAGPATHTVIFRGNGTIQLQLHTISRQRPMRHSSNHYNEKTMKRIVYELWKLYNSRHGGLKSIMPQLLMSVMLFSSLKTKQQMFTNKSKGMGLSVMKCIELWNRKEFIWNKKLYEMNIPYYTNLLPEVCPSTAGWMKMTQVIRLGKQRKRANHLEMCRLWHKTRPSINKFMHKQQSKTDAHNVPKAYWYSTSSW